MNGGEFSRLSPKFASIEFDSCALGTISGSSGEIVTKWIVKDQWGNPLPGVAIHENPTRLCIPLPTHDESTHIHGITKPAAEAVTLADGHFSDSFFADVGGGVVTRYTDTQHYSVDYGTYHKDNLLVFRVKVIKGPGKSSYTPLNGPSQDITLNQLSIKIDMTPETSWSEAQKNCKTDE